MLPGILQGDKSESLLYGSVDNGKKICWNEDFHSKVRGSFLLLDIPFIAYVQDMCILLQEPYMTFVITQPINLTFVESSSSI